MKSKIKKLDGTAHEFEIEASAEAVEKVYAEVLEDIRKKASIPGFREGKAPADIVSKKYNEDVQEEMKRRLVPEHYQKALDTHEVTPVSFPEISEVSMGPSGVLKFKARVDAHPEFKLGKYKMLKVNGQKIHLEEAEVEKTISTFRSMHAEFDEKEGPIEKGDFGICDVETFMDGQAIAKKRENMWVEADEESSMLGMGKELCGLDKGATKDIDVTLPEDYPDKKYAGKKAVLKIKVKDIRVKKLPELDDDLAKKSGYENVETLREGFRTLLMDNKKNDNDADMKKQIVETLISKHSFALPDSMVKRQYKVLMDSAENELLKKGISKEDIEAHKKTMVSQIQKDAQDKVKLHFILTEIADREDIIVEEEEVDKWLRSIAESYQKSFDEVKKYYEENDLIGGMAEQIRETKTLDLLLSEAEIKITGKK